MNPRDAFALIVRAFGAFFIYRAVDGAVTLIVVACGFSFPLKNTPATDAFFYLAYLLIGLFVVFWADRLVAVVYRARREDEPLITAQA